MSVPFPITGRIKAIYGVLLVFFGIVMVAYAYLNKPSGPPIGFQIELTKEECTHKSGLAQEEWVELTIVSGSKTGTYYPIAHDICVVAKDMDIKIDAMVGEGSLSNIDRVFEGSAQLGMVQQDMLILINNCITGMKQGGEISPPCKAEYMEYRDTVKLLVSMYLEEVHVIVKKGSGNSYQSLLGDKDKIIFASDGSYITALNIFGEKVNIKQQLDDNPLFLLEQGSIDAVVRVVGKSNKIGTEYGSENVELVAVPIDVIREQYGSTVYEAASLKYSWMEESVDTIGVRSIVIANDSDIKDKTAICTLSKMLNSPYYLNVLYEYGHPKWKNVHELTQIPNGWTRYDCST